MEHVIRRIPHKCHIFIRKFVTLVSLKVPSGSLVVESGPHVSTFTESQAHPWEEEEEEGGELWVKWVLPKPFC